ncbi:uncharacterized protein [Drosophila kikkawai]|uniref:Uncharacterized protein n=1 Tax=Drosophila kikkawai TaxID=30033 RepID=A0A6P4HUJ4_DROKI|nr:uncharacterized protein LOC108072613 [Drosophila kikkawai]
MLPLRASNLTLLIGFLCIAQGARIVRDTADIPTELFKPVGHNAAYELARSNRGNSTGQLYNGSEDSDTPVQFLERSSGGVEVVAAENDEEEEDELESQPLYRQGSRRTSGFPIPSPSFDRSFQRAVPRFGQSEISTPPFPRRSNIRPIFNPAEDIQDTPSWVSRPIQVPLSSNNFAGPSGSISSSNSFHRTESYSYSSDGRGPPRIQHKVYDSRDPFGGVSSRNF